ncbi:hypothetical protein F0L68_13070 [Solihabitans fulvus]|uniref:YGGT family protein n=1 Tax=Solihabitans fulvus TaxID=1892852 RepID=A0A5B2XG17_9PSEU|nr:hypothetical protein [Solihabitans fulvus]KAA2262216.1 hypothetical protein F0L68_13070 [Solihabitans fulvus]
MTTRRWHGTSGLGTAARIVSAVGAIFAVIEVVYILLIVLGADQANGFFKFVQTLAEPLALFFPGLFNPSSYDLGVILNYGLAAVFWLVVTGAIARILAR